MLKNTFGDVRLNKGKGEEWKIITGSRQRGTLSPLLYNFYTQGCIKNIVNQDVGCISGLVRPKT